MANLQNLKPMKKGQTLNPNGRPKLLCNVIKDLPKDMQERVYGILAYAIRLDSEETAKEYLLCKKGELGDYGFVLQRAIKELVDDNRGWSALMDIIDHLFGRPKQAVDANVGGELDFKFKFGDE